MKEPKPGAPWAFIAHKDNHWAGVTVADESRDTSKFVADFVRGGFSIVTVYSRDEYRKTLDGMKMWHDHPDYPHKKKRKAA